MSLVNTVIRRKFELIDLPQRAMPLDGNALSKVFGGCSKAGERCVFLGKNTCCGNCARITGTDGRVRNECV